jgi:hypothetical protein
MLRLPGVEVMGTPADIEDGVESWVWRDVRGGA